MSTEKKILLTAAIVSILGVSIKDGVTWVSSQIEIHNTAQKEREREEAEEKERIRQEQQQKAEEQRQEPQPQEQKQKVGAEKTIPVKYDYRGTFHDGLAPVKQNGKWGFIDTSGKEVIPLIYDDVYFFIDGLAWVRRNGKYGFINKSGKEVIPLIYDDVFPFYDGLAKVQLNGKWILINKQGKNVRDAEQNPKAEEQSQESYFPDEQKIKELINNYYSAFQNKQYDKLDNFFADTVHRYFAETDVSKASIKDRYKKYHEKTLRTKEISFSIQKNSFEQRQDSSEVVAVSFILDYYLNTERYGNQKYELKIDMAINKDYKIIEVNEQTLKRTNL